MTLNEIRQELKDRIREQDTFKHEAQKADNWGGSRFHDGKANGFEDALELLDELEF